MYCIIDMKMNNLYKFRYLRKISVEQLVLFCINVVFIYDGHLQFLRK